MKILYTFKCERKENGHEKLYILTMKDEADNTRYQVVRGKDIVLPGDAEIIKKKSVEDYEKAFHVNLYDPLGAPPIGKTIVCILKEGEYLRNGVCIDTKYSTNPETNESLCVVTFSFTIRKKSWFK